MPLQPSPSSGTVAGHEWGGHWYCPSVVSSSLPTFISCTCSTVAALHECIIKGLCGQMPWVWGVSCCALRCQGLRREAPWNNYLLGWLSFHSLDLNLFKSKCFGLIICSAGCSFSFLRWTIRTYIMLHLYRRCPFYLLTDSMEKMRSLVRILVC